MQENGNNNNINIYDLVNVSLSEYYGVCDVLVDFKHIMQNKQLLGFANAEREREEKGDECDVSKCYLIDRHERPKDYYSMSRERNNKLFFLNNQNETDNNQKSMAFQDFLDSIHCYYYHNLRIDLNQLFIPKDVDESEANIKDLCRDEIATKLSDFIGSTQRNSRRYRESHRNKNAFNKFLTTNKYSSTKTNKLSLIWAAGKEKEKEQQLCFMDDLLKETYGNTLKFDMNLFYAFYEMIVCEEYDTDSLQIDIENSKYSQSNIINSQTQIINKICKQNVMIYTHLQSQYSAGIRYFYWPFYKDNDAKYNTVYEYGAGAGIIECNEGYVLSDWHIDAVYGSFKEEMLNNEIAAFGVDEWDETKCKAQIKYEAWLKDPDWNLVCNYPFKSKIWEKLYGILDGALITIYHLMSLLFYTNFSSQQYEFTATFRRIFWNESDESMKKRHSYFAHWARLLRETVECFGTMMRDSPVKVFYHGISKEMLFQSTTFKIFAPLSTTAEFEIAHGTFSKTEGLVVDIWNDKLGQYLFNCQFFSDYTEENERFFIGGLQEFDFLSIHHIKVKQEYSAFIKPISLLAVMFTGFPFEISRVKKIDMHCLSLLLLNNLSFNIFADESIQKASDIPLYICNFFANFVNNIHTIELNMEEMNCHNEYAEDSSYGYKLLKPLFFIMSGNTNSETVNFTKLVKIFRRKLTQILIYKIINEKQGWLKSIYLNEMFLCEILNAIKIINKSVILSSIFKQFVIINPYDSIPTFIRNNQLIFQQNGWNLHHSTYHHPKRGIASKNCLLITPQ